MQLNSIEISKLIKERIAQFNIASEIYNEVIIISINNGIIRIYGLTEVTQGERLHCLIIFMLLLLI